MRLLLLCSLFSLSIRRRSSLSSRSNSKRCSSRAMRFSSISCVLSNFASSFNERRLLNYTRPLSIKKLIPSTEVLIDRLLSDLLPTESSPHSTHLKLSNDASVSLLYIFASSGRVLLPLYLHQQSDSQHSSALYERQNSSALRLSLPFLPLSPSLFLFFVAHPRYDPSCPISYHQKVGEQVQFLFLLYILLT